MSSAPFEKVAVPLADGATLYLRADVNALCEFESVVSRAGLDPLRELVGVEQGFRGTISALRALIWACAVVHHPSLTVQAVGDLLDQNGQALRDGLAEALKRSAPVKAEGDASGNPPPPSA
ncbi:hypothetical protein [Pararhodobacter zhoushanensis]|uniref:Gene transfer agent family protein n=1 Tax=Pararhodobacter zhoushanensis TaxID=2479545 RepID=A0ABT3H410_9RHOB|nr:hypothetical protein [Pararhodobacter zhoushanensis]MCW1934537.1 hypothetical protein [Pararhodobacter zhoushanensis]